MDHLPAKEVELTQPEHEPISNGLTNISLILGLLVAFMGFLVLLGWTFDYDALKSIVPNQILVKVNTGIGMFLCGISVAALSRKPSSNVFRFSFALAVILYMVLILLTLMEYLLQLNFGIDQFLFADPENSLNPGRMSPTTAFCFLNMVVAILLMIQKGILYLRRAIVMALSMTVLFIAGVNFLSRILNALFGTHFLIYTHMGIMAAVAFILLALALLLLLKDEADFNWSLSRATTIGCILWLLTLFATSSAFFRFINLLKQSDRDIIQTQQVNQELNNIFSAMSFFDNNLANKNSDNQVKHKKMIAQSLSNIDGLISDDTKQQELFNHLKDLVSQKINATKISGNTQITTFLNSPELLSSLNKFYEEENKLFQHRIMKQNFIFNQAQLISPLGIFLSISMLAIGLCILNTSIVEREKTKKSQKELANIVESSDDGIISKDLNGIIKSWNKGAEHIFGYTAEEMIGRPMLTLFPEDKVHEEKEILAKLRKGEKIEHYETVRKRKDGKPISVSVTISPIKNSLNQVIGASKIVRDFSEQKQLELQLRQSQKMSAIGQLSGGIAHDFNNILGIILGNLDLLERNLAGNEEALKRVNNTLKAATRGADLTKRLLAFSQMQQLSPTPTDLEESVINIVEMASRIVGSGINIQTQLDKSIPPVLIDTAELESALLNLVVNARDAMPEGGKLVIATRLLELSPNHLSVQAGDIKAGNYACISVSDTGEGMSPETIERVFEPFFTTKPRGKGTGMGLSMVYGFVKQSGGIIRVYSELGHGTTISLYLPFAQGTQLLKKQDAPLQTAQISGKVLVVDDEVDLLEIAALYLKDMGFDVFHAIDGKSALETFEKNPDIKMLVTDIIMPGDLNGFALAKKICQLKEDIIVVYVSGFPAGTVLNEDPDKINALLINKPYNRESFISTIYQALNNHLNSSSNS